MTGAAHQDFDRFEALSFDCYGTLIDWERGIADELVPWAARHGLDVDREGLLGAFAGHESVVQQQTPAMLYPAVLAETMRRLDTQFAVSSSDDEVAGFGSSVTRWPAFSDSAAALRRLHRHFRLVVLSNIDRESFAASQKLLGVEFDVVVTAQDVGAYKPSAQSFPAMYAAIGDAGIARERLLHVAQSLYHDHVPAKAAGMTTVWIDRRHDKPGSGATPQAVAVSPDWTFSSMAAFANAVLGDAEPG